MADPINKLANVCINVFPAKWQEVAEIAAAAEHAGVSDIGVVDSPLVSRDLYVSCVACLLETTELRVQTAVTNPVTRHPSVSAASALSLCELAPGRVTIGIATGDSALWGVGLKPAKIAELCEYIVALKTLLGGKEAVFRGCNFSWSLEGLRCDACAINLCRLFRSQGREGIRTSCRWFDHCGDGIHPGRHQTCSLADCRGVRRG